MRWEKPPVETATVPDSYWKRPNTQIRGPQPWDDDYEEKMDEAQVPFHPESPMGSTEDALLKPKTRKTKADKEFFQKFTDQHAAQYADILHNIALHGERSYTAHCNKCGRSKFIIAPDLRAKKEAIQTLRALGYGRPKQEDAQGSGGFTLVRKIVRSDDAA